MLGVFICTVDVQIPRPKRVLWRCGGGSGDCTWVTLIVEIPVVPY